MTAAARRTGTDPAAVPRTTPAEGSPGDDVSARAGAPPVDPTHVETAPVHTSHVDAVLAALAEPVRRRLMERLAVGPSTAGDLVALARAEFGISQPATSQHLRVLREAGVVTVRADGSRRVYAADAAALAVVGDWLRAFQDPFAQPLDALATELARGRRTRAADAQVPAEARRSARAPRRAAGA